jgi:hypothetical protein
MCNYDEHLKILTTSFSALSFFGTTKSGEAKLGNTSQSKLKASLFLRKERN